MPLRCIRPSSRLVRSSLRFAHRPALSQFLGKLPIARTVTSQKATDVAAGAAPADDNNTESWRMMAQLFGCTFVSSSAIFTIFVLSDIRDGLNDVARPPA